MTSKEEAFGPEKASYPSIGKYQDREVGVGGLVSRGRGDGLGDFQGRKPGKGTAFDM